MEGYSIEEINSGDIGFSSIIEAQVEDNNSIFIESTIADIRLMSESFIINESVYNNVKHKIKKFLDWIKKKVNSIIAWIKDKFFEKAEDVHKLADKVEKKIDSGEIERKIEEIKSAPLPTEEEKKIEPESPKPKEEEPKQEPKQEPKPEKKSPRSKAQMISDYKREQEEKIKAKIAKKIHDDKVLDIIKAAKEIIEVVKDTKLVASNFNDPSTSFRGPRRAEDIEEYLCEKLSDGKIQSVDQLAEFISGSIEEVELSAGLGKKIVRLVGTLKTQTTGFVDIYNIYKDKVDKWGDYVIKSLSTTSEENKQSAIEYLDYMSKMNNTILNLLTKMMGITNKLLADCEVVLKKLDSL